ncbi:MAG: hypothetical protein QME58_14360 [Bacteroidota bacterium]|nr:hypothetical protein [Bacteroidota bacterium]
MKSITPTIQQSNTLFLVLILLFVVSCRERVVPPDVPPYIYPITLTNEDVSCTEAFIRIKTTKVFEGGRLQLKRDGITRIEITDLKTELDTLIVDEGLLPKQTYTYKAFLHSSISPPLQSPVDSSAPLLLTTIDTTSSNFTWQIDTLGDGAGSVLYDVAVLSDTLAYAVGEIYKKDSTGQFETTPYNTARWNGKEWKLIRTKVKLNYGTSILYSYTALKSLFAFSKDDIWFVHNAGGVTRYHNGNWIMLDIPYGEGPGGANKIWGTSPNNLFFVGPNGRITFYNGVSWRRLESGTDQTINDVWGVNDTKTNEPFILAGASNVYNPGYIKLLQIKTTGYVDTIPWISQNRCISSVWFQNPNRLFTAGGGVFTRSLNGRWKEFKEIPLIYTSRIRGQDINDIFVAGHFGLVAHFNGVNWRVYPEVAAASYYSCDYKNNMLVAVGLRNARAVTLILRKR